MVTLVSGRVVWMGEKDKERKREKMAEKKGKEEEKAEKDVRGGRAAAATETMCGPQSLKYLLCGLLQRNSMYVSPRI